VVWSGIRANPVLDKLYRLSEATLPYHTSWCPNRTLSVHRQPIVTIQIDMGPWRENTSVMPVWLDGRLYCVSNDDTGILTLLHYSVIPASWTFDKVCINMKLRTIWSPWTPPIDAVPVRSVPKLYNCKRINRWWTLGECLWH
jgi:hypothetical protein